jgi:hypothetical protein
LDHNLEPIQPTSDEGMFIHDVMLRGERISHQARRADGTGRDLRRRCNAACWERRRRPTGRCLLQPAKPLILIQMIPRRSAAE